MNRSEVNMRHQESMERQLQGTTLAGVLALAGTCGAAPPQMPERAADVGLVGSFTPNMQIATGQAWMFAGGAIADFNKDGFADAYLISGGNVLDHLYMNQGNGTFVDEATEWGLTDVHCGNGASTADYDGDGHVDLYVTSFGNLGDQGGAPGRNKLYRNTGQGTFVDVAAEAGVAWVNPHHPCGYGSCWGDYNLDGHLDMYVACWWNWIFPKSGVLFRNSGNGTFENVTKAAGVHDVGVLGMQATFTDMNGNGWPDLLLAGDFGTSRYYRNNGDGTFTNITLQSGTNLTFDGMGTAIGDVDNDGLLDWYVTAIWPTQHPTGNTLYMNQGGHIYTEIAAAAGVRDGGWGWGTVAVDLDHDGWLELAEVNGRPATGIWSFDPPRLFHNNADGTFTNIAIESGMSHPDQGRGLARIDADRDGRQDLIVMNFVQPARFYRNETPDVGNWIGISFDTSDNPLLAPNGFGTHVKVDAGGKAYVRYMHGDPSYLSTSELNVHFGLGDAQVIDTITITWPRGYVTTLHDVPVNQYMVVKSPIPADLTADGSVGVADLLELLSKWGPVPSALDKYADLDNDGNANVGDLIFLLANWGSSK